MAPTGTSPSEPEGGPPDATPPGRPVRRPKAGPPATADDLLRAQQRLELVRTELTRVRTAAAAWRNGLGVLLAALVGFGLIKGRSDVSTLAPAAAAVVGVLLLLALVAGAAGALLLLRASFGEPRVVATRSLPSTSIAAHQEALASARGLRAGIALTLACAALLVAAVGTTWYGPARNGPKLLVSTGGDPLCGAVKSVGSGILVLDTPLGERNVRLATLTGIEPVDSCPGQ